MVLVCLFVTKEQIKREKTLLHVYITITIWSNEYGAPYVLRPIKMMAKRYKNCHMLERERGHKKACTN